MFRDMSGAVVFALALVVFFQFLALASFLCFLLTTLFGYYLVFWPFGALFRVHVTVICLLFSSFCVCLFVFLLCVACPFLVFLCFCLGTYFWFPMCPYVLLYFFVNYSGLFYFHFQVAWRTGVGMASYYGVDSLSLHLGVLFSLKAETVYSWTLTDLS